MESWERRKARSPSTTQESSEKTLGHVYDDTTVRVTPKDHQKIHRDEREVGPIGSLARHEIRKALRRSKKNKPF